MKTMKAFALVALVVWGVGFALSYAEVKRVSTVIQYRYEEIVQVLERV